MAKIKPSAAKKGTRLGTQKRGGLQKAYNQRGPDVAHLFHSYSLKTKRDVVLTGGLQFLHMLHAESDPLVVNVDYSPRVPGSDRDEDSGIDVEALIRGGTLELRTIRTHERADC